MVRTLFITALGTLIAGSLGAKTHIACSAGPELSTFLLKENKEEFRLRVHHEQGVEKSVIHSGEITPSDFAFLAKKASIFRKMGQTYEISFKKSNCLQRESDGWHCYISDQTQINDLSVDSLSFYLTPRQIRAAGLNYKQYHLGIELRIGDQVYNASQSFYDDDCRFPQR